MVTKAKTSVVTKPVLIKVGPHLVSPDDVSCITRLKSKKLYIVRLKSQPNMEFPIWVQLNEIDALLEYFDVKSKDVPCEDD
jgi:hypothetical protein